MKTAKRLLIAALLTFCTSPAFSALTFSYIGSFGKPPSRAPGMMNYPSSVAVDSATGNVFVMDKWFHRVQRFDADGSPIKQWQCIEGHGIEVDSARGFVYVAVPALNKVRQYDFNGRLLAEWAGDVTPDGSFKNPQDVAIHPVSGNVYVLDSGNLKVQILTPSGDFVGAWAGTWDRPYGIASDPKSGLVYVAETAKYKIHAYTHEGVLVNSWGKRGSLPGEMAWPRGLAVGADGSIYVADTDNERVQKFAPNGTVLDVFAGPKDLVHGSFHVRDVAVNTSTGAIYAVAAYQQRVDRFSKDGKYEISWGNLERDGEFLNQPKGLALDPTTGDVIVADMGNHVVKRFSGAGIFLSKIGEPVGVARNEYSLTFAQAITVDDEGFTWVLHNGIWYPDMPHWASSMYVRRFKNNGLFVSGFTDSSMNEGMGGIAVVSALSGLESVFVSNTQQNEIQHFSPYGKMLNKIGKGILKSPGGVLYDPNDASLVVVDIGNNRMVRFSVSGALVGSWGSFGTNKGQFKFISANAAAIDSFGNIYVADGGNHRVQVFDRMGAYMGEVSGDVTGTSARFRWPSAVVVKGNTLYVLDTGGNQVDMFSIQY